MVDSEVAAGATSGSWALLHHFLLFVLAWLIIWTIVGALSLKYQVELLLITDLLFLIIIGFYYVLSTGFVVIHYNVLVNQARAANPAQIRI